MMSVDPIDLSFSHRSISLITDQQIAAAARSSLNTQPLDTMDGYVVFFDLFAGGIYWAATLNFMGSRALVTGGRVVSPHLRGFLHD
jgi:hypothetical protein